MFNRLKWLKENIPEFKNKSIKELENIEDSLPFIENGHHILNSLNKAMILEESPYKSSLYIPGLPDKKQIKNIKELGDYFYKINQKANTFLYPHDKELYLHDITAWYIKDSQIHYATITTLLRYFMDISEHYFHTLHKNKKIAIQMRVAWWKNAVEFSKSVEPIVEKYKDCFFQKNITMEWEKDSFFYLDIFGGKELAKNISLDNYTNVFKKDISCSIEKLAEIETKELFPLVEEEYHKLCKSS